MSCQTLEWSKVTASLELSVVVSEGFKIPQLKAGEREIGKEEPLDSSLTAPWRRICCVNERNHLMETKQVITNNEPKSNPGDP